MASLLIRGLDARTKERLRVRAAQHNISMEEEARRILRAAVVEKEATGRDLVDAIRRAVAPFGGVELRLPKREPARDPPDFSR